VALPLLVMVDQEGGLVKRLPGGPGRSAAEVGATGSRRAALRDGRSAGSALRDAGANVDLAPVVDVCRAGAALDRERRCYSRRPAKVTRLAGAFAAGLRSRGVAATLKHFPGFGAARVNTDLAPVTIRTPRRRLRRIDEQPFASLASQAGLVMLSTAVYPALDRLPAVFSRTVATGELRGRLRFRGVSVSDALDTPAVARFGGPGRLALRAARAGTDIVLFGHGYRAGATAANTLAARLRAGRLRRGAFLRSAKRVMALRASLRSRRPRQRNSTRVRESATSPSFLVPATRRAKGSR
jgi:beta-N-acetylhexosaminidase